ncbi:hypothetical protein ACHAXH_003365 [Discostella pseudostelligera]
MSTNNGQCTSSTAYVTATAATTSSPLSRFDMHQYQPSPLLTDDENYMDIVMIITRTSQLRQGSMGCILVRSSNEMGSTREDGNEANNNSEAECEDLTVDNKNNNEYRHSLLSRIIAATTNTSLFTPNDSDVHAEINAIGQVARRQATTSAKTMGSSSIDVTTRGATAYITMPPCKKCFGALHAARIARIVSRRSHPMILHNVASKVGIQLVTLTQGELDSQKLRLDQLFSQTKRVGGGSEEKCNLMSSNDGSGDAAHEVVDDKEGVDTRNNHRKQTNEEDEERDSKVAKID